MSSAHVYLTPASLEPKQGPIPPPDAYIVTTRQGPQMVLEKLEPPDFPSKVELNRFYTASAEAAAKEDSGASCMCHVLKSDRALLPPTMFGGCPLEVPAEMWAAWANFVSDSILLPQHKADPVAQAAMVLQCLAATFPYTLDERGGDFGFPIHLLAEGDCEDYVLFVTGMAHSVLSQGLSEGWEPCAITGVLSGGRQFHVTSALRNTNTNQLYWIDVTAGSYPLPVLSGEGAGSVRQIEKYDSGAAVYLSPRPRSRDIARGFESYRRIYGMGSVDTDPGWYDVSNKRSVDGAWIDLIQGSSRRSYDKTSLDLIDEGRELWKKVIPKGMQKLNIPEGGLPAFPIGTKADHWVAVPRGQITDRKYKRYSLPTFASHRLSLYAYQPQSSPTAGRPLANMTSSDSSSGPITSGLSFHDLFNQVHEAAATGLKDVGRTLDKTVKTLATEKNLERVAKLAVVAGPLQPGSNNNSKKKKKPRKSKRTTSGKPDPSAAANSSGTKPSFETRPLARPHGIEEDKSEPLPEKPEKPETPETPKTPKRTKKPSRAAAFEEKAETFVKDVGSDIVEGAKTIEKDVKSEMSTAKLPSLFP